MARKHEFRMDRESLGGLGRLLLTKRQRLSLLKWSLYGLVCLVALLLQDVLLYRVDVLGAATDLVPCVILLIAMQQDAQTGSLFTLIGSLLYYCSGSSPGPYVIPILTALAVLLIIFRQGYLQQGFLAVALGTIVGTFAYELSVFFVGMILSSTMFSRIGVMLMTAALSLAVIPVGYPLTQAIGKIGGDLWND